MTPSRPYLVRAIREWILDNGMTPQVVVDASVEGVEVPRQHVRDGTIVLNISESAVRNLMLGNVTIEFDARFGGAPFHVRLPVQSVLAVVSRENGAGMSMPEEQHDDEPPTDPEPDPEPRGKKPTLRVVK